MDVHRSGPSPLTADLSIDTLPVPATDPLLLDRQRALGFPPLCIDVRKPPAFIADDRMLPGAIRRDPDRLDDWWRGLPPGRSVVVYCVHGHEVSRGGAAALRRHGVDAAYLTGGIEGWKLRGLPTRKRLDAPGSGASLWATRERPKIDRIACPWLVLRFVDPEARFLFVPATQVFSVARETGAIPFDIPGAEPYTHVGARCSFDAFVGRFEIDDPALLRMAEIIRGADTGHLDLAPEAAGLLALSLGLSVRFGSDDHGLLAAGLPLYDALYAACRFAANETHQWTPAADAAVVR